VTTRFALVTAVLCSAAVLARAQGGGPPPAAVEVGAVTEGRISPSAEFRATVFYKEVANVATEVEGKVIEVAFEEGDHITAGEPLIRLDAELLEADLASARATFQRARTLQQQEQVRLERAETLLVDDITTEQEFDDIRFTVDRYGHEADAAQAMVRRLETEIEKKVVRAPFDGVVLERRAEVGNWMASGEVLAVYARDDVFDIIANVPESRLPYIAAGQLVPVRALDPTTRPKCPAVMSTSWTSARGAAGRGPVSLAAALPFDRTRTVAHYRIPSKRGQRARPPIRIDSGANG